MDAVEFGRQAARFPDPELAQPDGLLALGGDLRPLTLLCAYSRGIFPWYSEDLPILWHAPNPRCVLFPAEFHLPRRSARKLASKPFGITFNKAFGEVIRACAAPRPGQDGGGWLLPEMIGAYERLHALGYAVSVEAWSGDGGLAGGLYGLALGKVFFGESMFHLRDEAGRAALAALVAELERRGFLLLDCQQESPHMLRMGARPIPRREFTKILDRALAIPAQSGDWPCPWAPWSAGSA